MRKNHGNEQERCRDLFTALWIPDLFMKRVQENGDWSLMCPDESPGLPDVYGEEFEKLYEKYESEGRFRKKIKAQQLWFSILKAQIETGTPYISYKDAVNIKTNQMNVGTVRNSNLCNEITIISTPEEYGTCNLASIALPAFIEYNDNVPSYNFNKLHEISEVLTRNMNKVIDRTFYPVPQAELSNKRHRPIGLGVQGLADVYAIMKYPFDSPEAAKLNREIFETIYHGAVTASMKIAKKRNQLFDELANCSDERREYIMKYLNLTPDEEILNEYKGSYSSYRGSPAYNGKLQFDLWGAQPEGKWDWDSLKADIKLYGLRNSLLIALMPTASTSQILGYNECFEPFTNTLFQRHTLAGEFTIINKYLIKDLLELGIWNTDLKNKMLMNNGSIQNIVEIPNNIKVLYKTVWELKQKALIDQAADRGIYVCQTQSMNLWMEDPDLNRLNAMHFYGWKKGLKTGIYYLRTRPKAKVTAFTIEPVKVPSTTNTSTNTSPIVSPTYEEQMNACRLDNPEGCLMCGS